MGTHACFSPLLSDPFPPSPFDLPGTICSALALKLSQGFHFLSIIALSSQLTAGSHQCSSPAGRETWKTTRSTLMLFQDSISQWIELTTSWDVKLPSYKALCPTNAAALLSSLLPWVCSSPSTTATYFYPLWPEAHHTSAGVHPT